VQLRDQDVKPDQVERIELRVHSLVLELTGKKEPKDGLQGKFSVYHGCAVGLIHGRAGEEEFSDAVVNDPAVIALRNKVQATVDDSIKEEAVQVTAVLKDGRRIEVRVDHAIGSVENPLSDAQLQAKFAALVVPVLGQDRCAAITNHWRSLAGIADIQAFVALCRP
jgi:2-methylcitrate dehydratase PrpD